MKFAILIYTDRTLLLVTRWITGTGDWLEQVSPGGRSAER